MVPVSERKGDGRGVRREPSELSSIPHVGTHRAGEPPALPTEVDPLGRAGKKLAGVGQTQVRCPEAMNRAPAFLVACYAALLLVSRPQFRRPPGT